MQAFKSVLDLICNKSSEGERQARRHGGAFRGRALPNDCLCPPERKLSPAKRGLFPAEINRLGATGVQIEA